MADWKRQDSIDDGGDDLVGSDDVTTTVGSIADNNPTASSEPRGRVGLADRLSEILVEDGDGDLLLQQSDRENNFLQWLQALDLQVMGACRADERLKPLLKANGSSGAAEDRLLAHLSQHFEASEVGLLARCLCVPLVSMRVGKIVKQGRLLCPSSVRGNLNLTLLPSSDLRISFVGDDGHTQRLATLHDVSECSAVEVEDIPADQSGRSFLVKVDGGETFYFWCAEKSELLGSDLFVKMKDLLKSKPTLSELTGISESRLECFASHLRAYLVGSRVNNSQTSTAAQSTPWLDIRPDNVKGQSSTNSVRPLRSRHASGQALKGPTLYQGSLSPRSSSFKEGFPKTLSSLRSASREKRRRGDFHLLSDSSLVTDAVLNLSELVKSPEVSSSSNPSSPLSFLESLEKSYLPPPSETLQFPPISSLFSPYYCWCPPCTSPTMSTIPQLSTSSSEPFSLPPLSTLLPATGPPNLLAQLPPLNLSGGPPPSYQPLELPALVSDPFSRLSFSNQTSQQLPSFIPLMCDPIVHIPVLDICSSGQSYLVSAGPAISTNIPPLHPKLVGPLIPESESVLEKGARETLRLLIGSGSVTQPSASLMNVLPDVLNSDDKQGVVVAGSRGLYSGTSDVNAIVNSFAAIGLASLSERSLKVMKSCDGTIASEASGGEDAKGSTFMSREEEKQQ